LSDAEVAPSSPKIMKPKILVLILCIASQSVPCVFAQSAAAPSGSKAEASGLDANSEYEEGKKFLHGRGVEKDPAKALEHFQKAAELGHIEAPGAIGYFYSVGLVAEKDEAKAAECFQKGSEKGSALAKFNLGRFHLDGKGGLSGTEKGLALMEESASLGLPEAHAALAEIYFLGLYCGDHKPDYAKAAPHVKAAAASGEPAAINMLGVMKQSGLGLEKDKKGAEDCFRRAAMKGDFKAPSNLGHLLNPESKNRSRRVEATAWLIIAASQGEPLATRKISELEQTMSGKDFSAAREKADALQAKIAETAGN
jgi:TPR repeat protein